MPSGYELLRSILSDRVIAFHPALARAFGGVYEALLFQQIAYWSDKGDDPDWIYKTRDEIMEETTLNRYQQEQARATLRKLGVLQEERRGLPARMHYRIVWDVAFALLEERQAVGRGSAVQLAEGRPTSRRDSPEQMGDGGPAFIGTEKTTKTTSGDVEDSNVRETSLLKYDDDRLDLLGYIEGYAREFRDQAPLASSVTRAVNLYKASGFDLDTFVTRMEQARAITKERTGSVKAGEGGRKNLMAFWFAVVEDLLGQRKERSGD